MTGAIQSLTQRRSTVHAPLACDAALDALAHDHDTAFLAPAR